MSRTVWLQFFRNPGANIRKNTLRSGLRYPIAFALLLAFETLYPTLTAAYSSPPAVEIRNLSRQSWQSLRAGNRTEAIQKLKGAQSLLFKYPDLFTPKAKNDIDSLVFQLSTPKGNKNEILKSFSIKIKSLDPLGNYSYSQVEPKQLFIPAQVPDFGNNFRESAQNADDTLNKEKQSRFADPRTVKLINPWANTPKDRRMFVTGSNSDEKYVETLRPRYEAEGHARIERPYQILGAKVASLAGTEPKQLSVSAGILNFGIKFRAGAQNPDDTLNKEKQSRFTDPKIVQLIDTWRNTPKDSRVFVTGSNSDEKYVETFRAQNEAEGYIFFFYKYCQPLCSEEAVGAFMGSASTHIHIDSPGAEASPFIPLEIALINEHKGEGPTFLLIDLDQIDMKTGSYSIVKAIQVRCGSGLSQIGQRSSLCQQ